jgi:hypothetical protein
MSSVPRAVLFVLVLIVSGLAGALPVASTAGGLAAHPLPAPLSGVPAAPSATTAAPVHPGIHPHPSVLPCNTNPRWPVWFGTGDGFPPTPTVSLQSGCGGTLYAAQDEEHASFLSNVQGSAQRWTESIYLPMDSLQVQSYGGFYLGEVVKGDPKSAWNQSYAEVSFWPQASGFTSTLSVYSLENDTNFQNRQINFGNCSLPLTLAWNSTIWCEGSDFSNLAGDIETTIPGGSWVNVTFNGVPAINTSTKVTPGTPLSVWVNDSTNSGLSWNGTLNNVTTGTFNFTPAYSYANETNLLAWGMGEGNGINFDNCPAAASGTWAGICDSYNSTEWYNTPDVEFGIPQYYHGTTYSSDFQYLGFESSSGACGYVPGSTGNPTVAICIANTPGSGGNGVTPDGYYPYFAYNGSLIDYGAANNWSTWDFGGQSIQFNPAGTTNAKIPMYLDRISDSSRGGFVTNTTAFNVTSRLQVVGHIANASLIYQLPGGSGWTSLTMTRVNGSSTLGYWNGTIPVSGAGTVAYWIFIEDVAGEGISSIVYDVTRGPLPQFNIQFVIAPKFCGTVIFNGSSFTNGQSTSIEPGGYSLNATGCWPYISPIFTASHLLIIHSGQTRVDVRGSGTITVTWSFNPPKLNLKIAVAPATCAGSVWINSINYVNGDTAIVTWNRSYLISYVPCGQYDFEGYSGSSLVNITVSPSNTTVLTTKNGTLTVNFVSASIALPVLFLVEPTTCGGGVLFNGADYLNGSGIAVSAGAYPIGASPCGKFGFLKWSLGGNPVPTISGGNITISSESTIEMIQYWLTIITVQTDPKTCGTVMVDGTSYTNGQSFVVLNNSTHSIDPIPCAGYALLGVGVTGGLTLAGNIVTANGSGDILVSFSNGSFPAFVGFETTPAYCGSIGFNGGVYEDTNSTKVAKGTVASLSATPCAGEGFLRWLGYNGVTIVGNTAYVNDSGSIQAVFTELVNIYIHTDPTNCGSIVLNGVAYPDGSTPAFPIGQVLTLSADPCPGYHLSVYNQVGITLQNNDTELQVNDPGALSALFSPVTYGVTTVIDPANCAVVLLNGLPTINGSTQQFGQGVYPLVIRPCQGDEVAQVILSGGVAIVGNVGDQVVYVNGSGTITILLGAVPPQLTLSVPPTAGAGLGVFFGASIAVLVRPYNYSYNWSFGDGTNATTNVNATEHVYSAAGTYLVKVVVTDPLGRKVSASATIAVGSLSSAQQVNDALPALIAAGLALVVIAAAWVYSGRRGPPSKTASDDPEYSLPGVPAEPDALPGPVEPSTLTGAPTPGTPEASGEPFPKEP